MERRKLAESFNTAIEGFIFVLKTQYNMRVHFVIGACVLFAGIYLNISKTELLLLTTAITFVLISEMFNTAVELIIDLITDTFHPLARIIKDITAGCVLLAAINSVVVGYLVFCKFFFNPDTGLFVSLAWIKQKPWHITFLAILLVLFFVIVTKTFFGKGRPLRGGMPSGHSAIAFSIWTTVALNTTNKLLIVLSFFLAVLVAQSRVKTKIHNIWEVLLGSLLGILVTVVLFQLFS
ncbi:MAG: diacylglycerol kinase [Candidatus Omnitrophota bacterium]